MSYSQSSGTLTHIDTDDQGGSYEDAWGDGTYIYAAAGSAGLMSYSQSSGTLTYIDADDQGGVYYDVWGDGTYIYAACGDNGIRRYSQALGILTHIDTDYQGIADYRDVWGDNTYVYTACATDGLRSYGVKNLQYTEFNHLVIHGHNFGTAGATYTLQYSDDGFVSDINNLFTGVAASSDNTILHEFSLQSANRFRLKIENATVAPEIAIMYLGETVELDYASTDYDPNSEDDKAIVNTSQTGYVTGIYDKYIERSMSITFNDMDSTLYNKLVAWHDEIGRENFVIAWDTGEHSTEAFLMRHTGKFNAPLTKQGVYRNITLKFLGRK
jgi:hypothetical protein